MVLSEDEADALLIQLAQRAGGIVPLLEAMFSFLKRKTDFYHVQRPGDRIGFPEGPRPQIRLAGFLTMRSSVTESSFESGCVEQELEETGRRFPPPSDLQATSTAVPRQSPAAPATIPAPASEETASGLAASGAAASGASSSAAAQGGRQTQTFHAKSSMSGEEWKRERSNEGCMLASDGAGVAGKNRESDGNFVAYNGGVCEGYKWSQTVDEVVVFLDLGHVMGGESKSGGVGCGARLRGKDLSATAPPCSAPLPCAEARALVVVAAAELQITARGKEVLRRSLLAAVKQEELVWHLEEGRFLTITVEKKLKTWWKSFFADEAREYEIDTQKVDSSCRIDDYDQATQAAIEKLVFDQQQKLQGKPTSDELLTHEALRKAWDADGSPFKGTQFDPTAVNITGSGSGPSPGTSLGTACPPG